MIYPVKKIKEELINEFAVSKMNIDTFCKMHNIKTEALESWIREKMERAELPRKGEGESDEALHSSDFVELDIPKISKIPVNLSKNPFDYITVRAGGIEIDIPIVTDSKTLFTIFSTAASI